jgi:hypothetical protein
MRKMTKSWRYFPKRPFSILQDQLDAAQALLRKAVLDKAGNPQAWLMFDLYKLRGLKRFEDLAMTYTVVRTFSAHLNQRLINRNCARNRARQVITQFSRQSEGMVAEVANSSILKRLGSVLNRRRQD